MSVAAFIVDDSFDAVLEAAICEAATALDAVGAAVVIVDDLHEHFVATVGVDPGLEISRAVSREIGCGRIVVAAGGVVVIADTLLDSRVRPEVGELLGIRAIVGVPLVVDGVVIGALILFDRQPRQLDPAALPAGLIHVIEARLTARRTTVDVPIEAVVAQRPALRLVQAMQAGAVPVDVFKRALQLLPPVRVPELR